MKGQYWGPVTRLSQSEAAIAGGRGLEQVLVLVQRPLEAGCHRGRLDRGRVHQVGVEADHLVPGPRVHLANRR